MDLDLSFQFDDAGGEFDQALHAQTAILESGFVRIPETAPWLAEYLHERGAAQTATRQDRMGDRFHGMACRAEGSGLNRGARFGAPVPRSQRCDKDQRRSSPYRGTEGSNPPPSSGEFGANLTFGDESHR